MPRVDRLEIGIFGRINAGKSTLMNLLTQQETSIVDPAPGTTADIKSAVMEIHALGPVRLLDTAGLDEGAPLGAKKRRKTQDALEEVDLALLVVDPIQSFLSGDLSVEAEVSGLARRLGRRLAVVFNRREDHSSLLDGTGATFGECVEHCRSVLPDRAGTPHAVLDLSDPTGSVPLAEFIATARPAEGGEVDLLPFLGGRGPVLLHIPLDEESPSGRLLRPQEMAMERLLRLGVPVGLYRTDLMLARSSSEVIEAVERAKFLGFLGALGGAGKVQLVLTDSQAIDVMDRWVPAEVPLTTFSIMMIHSTSGGSLPLFARGAAALDGLRPGDRVLIAEACNHDRIAEDIGTVQLPRKLGAAVPGIVVDHAFGREFPSLEELAGYSVVIHCGGCMISTRKLGARVTRLAEAGVPVTNYGMALAWLEGSGTLGRVLAPWEGREK
jgi:[FeFe] hydrogenase H-cluster maturation GTPase HydF